MDARPTISAIIPVFGHEAGIIPLVAKLKKQTIPPSEIILVDSSPSSWTPPEGTVYIKLEKNLGESVDYNEGVNRASGEYLLFLQQDSYPENENGIETLLQHMDDQTVAVTSMVHLSKELFDGYDFWGKVLMLRWVGDVKQGVSNKFDLFRRKTFLEVGKYDSDHFRTTGHDIDLCIRLAGKGLVKTISYRAIHYHHQNTKTSVNYVIKKHYNHAMSGGVLIRRWGFKVVKAPYTKEVNQHKTKFLFLLVFALPFYPLWTLIAFFIGSQLVLIENWRIPGKEKWLLLFFHPILILAEALGTLKGFFKGIQSYSINAKLDK
jgi:glycosyltransferase involved in cell wall biosynthesis